MMYREAIPREERETTNQVSRPQTLRYYPKEGVFAMSPLWLCIYENSSTVPFALT